MTMTNVWYLATTKFRTYALNEVRYLATTNFGTYRLVDSIEMWFATKEVPFLISNCLVEVKDNNCYNF